MYQKFTSFYNKCNSVRSPVRNSERTSNLKLTNSLHNKYSTSLSEISKKLKIESSPYRSNSKGISLRTTALKKLNSRYDHYNKNRDLLTENTTGLSVYLKFGIVSIREAYHEFKGNSGLKRQLIWREFYYHLLSDPITVHKLSTRLNITWNNSESRFTRWCNGETGFPIVDANMRMLNESGQMHNRGRLIVASFLVKTLLINWKKGERYFAQKLLDYDPLMNLGNWLWISSFGIDSQPYFRIFNPWLQSKKADPDAQFIKKWIPELKDVSASHIHNWNVKHELYNNIYLTPMVDHDEEKKKVINAYKNGH
jgi:deoxyribodipyrimidine photo-lyase